MRQAASRIVLNYATGFSDRNKGVPHEPALGYVPLAGRPLLVHTHGWEGPPMRILVADRLPDRFVEAMERRGHACTVDADLTEASLPTSVAGMDVVVVRSIRVTGAVFSAVEAPPHPLAHVLFFRPPRRAAARGACRLGHEHHRL
jgi:hypothetical protein